MNTSYIFSVFLLVCSYAVNGDDLKLIPDQPTLWVVVPAKLILQCEHHEDVGNTENLDFQFTKDGIHSNSLGFMQTRQSRMSKDDGNTTTTLIITLEKSRVALSGIYKCSTGILERAITVNVIEMEASNGELEKEQEPVTLTCDVKGVDVNVVTNVWHKNEVPLQEMPQASTKYSYSNDSLSVTILKPVVQDAGQYSCNMTFDEGQSSEWHYNLLVDFYAKPLAEMKDKKSRNLAQEATLLLKCSIFGYPSPNVTWLKDSKKLDPSEDRRISIIPHGVVPISELHVVELDFDDRGNYACEVSSDRFPNYTMKATLLIRVKDKLAALWPFLVTVAEVIILCIIIFICEKRKSKEMEDDADGATDNAVNATDKCTDDVRQRNVRA